MSKGYYPLDFLTQRSYARKFLRLLDENSERITPDYCNKVASDLVVEHLRRQGWSWAAPGASTATLSQEVQGLLAFGEWARGGRTVVDTPRPLADAFARSDSGDMRISDVFPQHRASYFRFDLSDENAIAYSSGRVVFEGAYVLFDSRLSTRVVLCGRPLQPLAVGERWLERYDLRIPAKYYDVAADEAVTAALSDDLADLREARRKLTLMAEARVLGDVDALSARMEADHGAFSAAVRLVLNALAYWKHVPDDIEAGWTDGAPARLLSLAAPSAAPREQARALDKLWALGHIPVLRLGPRFAEQTHRPEQQGVRLHWRRGHWRQQPHGPKLMLRKLIWIQPTQVGGSE